MQPKGSQQSSSKQAKPALLTNVAAPMPPVDSVEGAPEVDFWTALEDLIASNFPREYAVKFVASTKAVSGAPPANTVLLMTCAWYLLPLHCTHILIY